MKFLLIPITLVLWLVLTYLLLWLCLSASLVVLNFSWITLLFSSLILIGVGTILSVIIPTSISVVIEHFYNHNRFINILHAIFGILGVLLFLNYLTADHVRSIIRLNWISHKWKIIVLSLPITGMFVGMIYSSVSMILNKKESDQKFENNDHIEELFAEDKIESNKASILTEKEMEYIRKARAYRLAKNQIKIERERAAINANKNIDSSK